MPKKTTKKTKTTAKKSTATKKTAPAKKTAVTKAAPKSTKPATSKSTANGPELLLITFALLLMILAVAIAARFLVTG